MRERGGHFSASLAFAVGAHALLFLLAWWFLVRPVQSVSPRIELVEIQLSGGGTPGSGGGAGGREQSAPQRKAARRNAPTVPAAPAAPTPAPAPARAPAAPAPQSQAPPAAAPAAAGQAAAAAAPAPAAASSQPAPAAGVQGGEDAAGSAAGSGWGDSGFGGGGPGAGSEESGGAGSSSGSGGYEAPGVISDIDPAPIRPISPSYPASARRLGQEGLVKVQADIDADGFVTSERIAASSGFSSLDNAALDAVKAIRFMPARKNGRAVASRIIIPIRFRLTEE